MASRFFITDEPDDSIDEDVSAEDELDEEGINTSSSLSCNYDDLLAPTQNTQSSPSEATLNDQMLSYLDERVIWEGSPSQWLNFGRYCSWGSILALSVLIGYFGWQYEVLSPYPNYKPYAYLIVLSGILVPTGFILYFFLKLKMHKVVITYNKITESVGFTDVFRREKFCELSDVKDIIAPPAGWLALVRRGDLQFHTMDSDQSLIHIRAMKGRHRVKQQLIPLIRRLRAERRGVGVNSGTNLSG